MAKRIDLPRVTYTNTADDFTAVHALLDELLPSFEAEQLDRSHAAVIDGKQRFDGTIERLASPIDGELIIGEFAFSTPSLVQEAVEAARRAFKTWKTTPWQDRLAHLRAAARLIDARKYDIALASLVEVGKSRMEAVGEVEEAIDLVNYYCAEMERNDGFRVERARAVRDERSYIVLRPYGVFAVIAPFNFPVALSIGMVSAALIAGNTVVFKPGRGNGLTARMLTDCLLEAGVPAGVFNLLFGGAEVGETLAKNPGIDGFAFTGSHDVGMSLLRDSAKGSFQKPVLAEMGGKNPVFVTNHADLRVAALGIARSAFGLQGQKCSAASKAYVQEDVYEEFLSLLVHESAALQLGDPRKRETFLGPLATASAFDRFTAAVDDARAHGRIVFGGHRSAPAPLDRGFFVQPTIIDRLDETHRLNCAELFLPVLSVLRFETLSTAVTTSNRSHFGLTAGIYTTKTSELEFCLDNVEAGVLYANRASGATTGAWPGIQSFCGWKGSGMTGKGGLGPWYLPLFMREQSHTLFSSPGAV